MKQFCRVGRRFVMASMMALLTIVWFEDMARMAEAACSRCASSSIPLPRQTFGSTNFLSAYVNRDARASASSGCFWADGVGMMRKFTAGQPIRFTISFLPVVDMPTITKSGTGTVTVGGGISSNGGNGSISGSGSFTHATTTGGFIILNIDTFRVETDGATTRLASIGSSTYCPMIPTTKVWMQGKAEVPRYSSRLLFAITAAI